MKVQIIGKSCRQSVNQQTGAVRIYTNLYFIKDFSDYEKQNGAIGNKCDQVNTALDCSNISVGDVVNFDYGPTGYKNKDGSDQMRLLEIELLGKAK